ncbi:MerR family transcriptional regulator [Bacillus sp. 03113]|uniref:MerR family transcriptional regulator n=1 Tax=Bacillus sp. 03113 TaxID=2578211 RepID=UPI0011435EED|nr:MerR family transcriptional regulator [Bacillus sp. 03113]
MNKLTISQVAKASNVNIETIRYYERKGLIPHPQRTESRYRMFPLHVIQEVKFIKRAQVLGFSLKDIKKLLTIVKKDEILSRDERFKFALTKVKEIDEKIKGLIEIKSMLELIIKEPNLEEPEK